MDTLAVSIIKFSIYIHFQRHCESNFLIFSEQVCEVRDGTKKTGSAKVRKQVREEIAVPYWVTVKYIVMPTVWGFWF